MTLGLNLQDRGAIRIYSDACTRDLGPTCAIAWRIEEVLHNDAHVLIRHHILFPLMRALRTSRIPNLDLDTGIHTPCSDAMPCMIFMLPYIRGDVTLSSKCITASLTD